MTHSKDTIGLLFVISAPSGAGKTSVLKGVFEEFPESEFSVSVTTRKPRVGEHDGVNYHFVTDEEFDHHIANDDFVEWAEVYQNRYGTLKSTIQEALDNGKILFLDIDTVGAAAINSLYPDAASIFIAPPSPEVLLERLKLRNTDPSEHIKVRTAEVASEMAKVLEYDYVVVNDTLAEAISQVSTIIKAERLRSKRSLFFLTSWKGIINGF